MDSGNSDPCAGGPAGPATMDTDKNTGNMGFGNMGFGSMGLGNTNPFYLNLMHCDDKDLLAKLNNINVGSTNAESMNLNQENRGYMNPNQTNPGNPDAKQGDPKDMHLFNMDPAMIQDDDEDTSPPLPGFKMMTGSEFFLEKPITLVSRQEWGALPPRYTKPMKHPIQKVIISYKSETTPCFNREECSQRMRELQKFHMENESLADIPYNFMVGHDGTLFEGRGWNSLSSASLKSYPQFSGDRLDVAYFGDYRKVVYPIEASSAIYDLLKEGADEGLVNTYCEVMDYREGEPED